MPVRGESQPTFSLGAGVRVPTLVGPFGGDRKTPTKVGTLAPSAKPSPCESDASDGECLGGSVSKRHDRAPRWRRHVSF